MSCSKGLILDIQILDWNCDISRHLETGDESHPYEDMGTGIQAHLALLHPQLN